MPFRRSVLMLALISTLTGCIGEPPCGPIAQYSPGSQSVAGNVTCEADYTLVARDENGLRGFGQHHVRRGDRVGFRAEADGTVTAVAPGYSLTLPAGSYAWEAVPGSVPSERERWLCETRRHALTAAKVTGVVAVCALAAIPILVIIAFASGGLNFT